MSDPNPNSPHLAGGARRAEPSAERHPAPRRPGVLVVDDEDCVRGALAAGLRREGYAVWLAADGQDGLAVYWSHHADIDVVLLDVRMPNLDGPQTLAALRELNPRVRCCFMSGNLGDYTESELRELGAAGLLHKPFPLAEVAHILGPMADDALSVSAAAEEAG